jgi:hypothetical protein
VWWDAWWKWYVLGSSMIMGKGWWECSRTCRNSRCKQCDVINHHKDFATARYSSYKRGNNGPCKPMFKTNLVFCDADSRRFAYLDRRGLSPRSLNKKSVFIPCLWWEF